MEEHISVYVCERLINDYILPKALNTFTSDNRAIAAFSLKQSTALTQSLVVSEDYCPDQPRSRLSEDQPIASINMRNIRIYPANHKRQSIKPKISILGLRPSKVVKSRDQTVQSTSIFNNIKLTPLQTFEDQENQEDQNATIQTRLRQRKMHQQYFRTRYQENFRQGTLKKKGFANKGEGKGHNIVAYDFDGGIIDCGSGKQDAAKLPIHYLDLQVHVAEKQEDQDIKKRGSRIKMMEPRRQSSIKRQDLKIYESHFLKDFHGIQWSEGVELRQSKQECRQILGYQNPNLQKKKKIDLFKTTNNQPVHVKLQDLKSYKNLLSSNSQVLLSSQNLHRQSQKSMLSRVSTQLINSDSKSKVITVTNSRALEFLIDNDHEPQKKKSGFATNEKRLGKSLHFND